MPDYRPHDYVAPVFSFNTTEAGLGDQFGLLGLRTTTGWTARSRSSSRSAPRSIVSSGYGFTGTTIHEVGHHIGMSHPHDGWDSEGGFDYGPGGSLYFAWAGDESDTVMHYLGLTNGFGKHNKDNMYRWETAGYLNLSNALVADILASPDARRVAFAVRTADLLAGSRRASSGSGTIWKPRPRRAAPISPSCWRPRRSASRARGCRRRAGCCRPN